MKKRKKFYEKKNESLLCSYLYYSFENLNNTNNISFVKPKKETVKKEQL